MSQHVYISVSFLLFLNYFFPTLQSLTSIFQAVPFCPIQTAVSSVQFEYHRLRRVRSEGLVGLYREIFYDSAGLCNSGGSSPGEMPKLFANNSSRKRTTRSWKSNGTFRISSEFRSNCAEKGGGDCGGDDRGKQK